jgi:hypothetical protein
MSKQLIALVLFSTWDEARDAEVELRAAGYSTKILDDIFENLIWMDVWRPSAADSIDDPRLLLECKELDAIIDPLGGFCDEYLIRNHWQPREVAFPTTWTLEEGETHPRDEYWH